MSPSKFLFNLHEKKGELDLTCAALWLGSSIKVHQKAAADVSLCCCEADPQAEVFFTITEALQKPRASSGKAAVPTLGGISVSWEENVGTLNKCVQFSGFSMKLLHIKCKNKKKDSFEHLSW